MTFGRTIRVLAVALTLCAGGMAGQAGEKSSEKVYPLWDGKESVADYAKRAGLEPTMALDLSDGVKVEFVLIPAGKFMMGSPKDEKGREDREGPQHDVTIGKPFYMGKFEVTQVQYEILTKRNPSRFKGAMNPVEHVSWYAARSFCEKLSMKAGRVVRLPSEAEWEYACRAGSKTPFHPPREYDKSPPLTDEQRRRVAELIPKLGSNEFAMRDKATQDLIALGRGIIPLLEAVKTDDGEVQRRLTAVKEALKPKTGLESVAWYEENSDEKPHPVGGKEPNTFGLHDMHGNVEEWVEDDWHDNYNDAPLDGRAWINTPRAAARVLRGGSGEDDSGDCRSARRSAVTPDYRFDDLGFRVVIESSSPKNP
jgi:formylglycine-generating enzyme required for sulfatase activity